MILLIEVNFKTFVKLVISYKRHKNLLVALKFSQKNSRIGKSRWNPSYCTSDRSVSLHHHVYAKHRERTQARLIGAVSTKIGIT